MYALTLVCSALPLPWPDSSLASSSPLFAWRAAGLALKRSGSSALMPPTVAVLTSLSTWYLSFWSMGRTLSRTVRASMSRRMQGSLEIFRPVTFFQTTLVTSSR
uniref:Putative secreted protein n=1 Tax=Ixodes ricinus TaxID=34613 RepID=A0A6B0UH45_IXORI